MTQMHMYLMVFPVQVPLQFLCNDRTVAPFHCGKRCYCWARAIVWVLRFLFCHVAHGHMYLASITASRLSGFPTILAGSMQ